MEDYEGFIEVSLILSPEERELIHFALMDAREREFNREEELISLPDGEQKDNALNEMNKRIRMFSKLLKTFKEE